MKLLVDGTSSFLDVVDKHMPIKTKRVKKKHSPWMNAFIFDLMKQRDKIKKKAKSNQLDDYWKQYRKMRNKVTLEITKAKKRYYTEKIRDFQGRSKSLDILKLLMPTKQADSANNTTSSNEQLADEFNSHFANVGNCRLNYLLSLN